MIKTSIENEQNLIVEGCYIPFDWRTDFDDKYLENIRFICLAMTDNYIDVHFDEIKAHSSDIESRFEDEDITVQQLREDNQAYIRGRYENGESVTLNDEDYEQVIKLLLK